MANKQVTDKNQEVKGTEQTLSAAEKKAQQAAAKKAEAEAKKSELAAKKAEEEAKSKASTEGKENPAPEKGNEPSADKKEEVTPPAPVTGKEDQSAPAKEGEAKPTDSIGNAEDKKPEGNGTPAPENPAAQNEPPKAEETKVATYFIDDISSPSLGKFALKQKGKLIAHITGEEQLAKLGLPVWDDSKYAKRNNYTDHVKFELMNMVIAGKFNSPKAVLKWAENGKKFEFEGIIAPAPKTTTAKNSTGSKTPEQPIDLGNLNFG